MMCFTVGYKLEGTGHHIKVDAEDALMAALKVKIEHSRALIMYVRPQNKRGDARHPALKLADETASPPREQL